MGYDSDGMPGGGGTVPIAVSKALVYKVKLRKAAGLHATAIYTLRSLDDLKNIYLVVGDTLTIEVRDGKA